MDLIKSAPLIEARLRQFSECQARDAERLIAEIRAASEAAGFITKDIPVLLAQAAALWVRGFEVPKDVARSESIGPNFEFRAGSYQGQIHDSAEHPLGAGKYRLIVAVIPVTEPVK